MSAKPPTRPPLPRGLEWGYAYGAWGAAVVLALLALLLFRDYGMAWDDAQHAVYGSYVLDYFKSGFLDMRWRHDIGGLYFYGTLFDLPSAWIHRMVGDDLFRFRALFMAWTGVLTLPAVVALGRRMGGNPGALFAGLALLAMPQFVGQSFINCKDIPLACAMSWCLLAVVRLVERPEPLRLWLCGLAFGAALSIRIAGGVLALAFAGAVVGAALFQAWRNQRLATMAAEAWNQRLPFHALGAGVMAWGLMVLFWPYAHAHPLMNPIEAVLQSTDFPISYPVRYLGETWESARLPWHYLPVMLTLTLPLSLLLLVVTGIGVALWRVVRHPTGSGALTAFAVLFPLFFTLAYVAKAQPNIYDGVRHFLFLLPVLAVLAGAAGAALARLRFGSAAAALLLLAALPPLFTTHPYQYTFYNILAGDRSTLHERFETDYWLTSYREAAGVMDAEQRRAGRPLKIGLGANGLSVPCFSYYARTPMELGLFLGSEGMTTFPRAFDYTVTVPRYGMWRNFSDAPVFYEIRRDGVLLCVIRRNPHNTTPASRSSSGMDAR